MADAADHLLDVIKQQPNNFEARFILGKVFCILNQEQEGLAQIKWASKIDAENAMPNLYVTLFYSFKSEWPIAQDNLKLLEKKLSDDPELKYLAGQIGKKSNLDKNDNKIKQLMLRCHYPI